MVVLMAGMVTVSSADMQTTCGWRSSTAATKFSWRNIGAEIDHLESAAFEHGCNDVLADVVQVAFDRPDDHADSHLLAGAASSGRSSSMALFMARPASRSSGTKYSSASNSRPTSSMAGTMYS